MTSNEVEVERVEGEAPVCQNCGQRPALVVIGEAHGEGAPVCLLCAKANDGRGGWPHYEDVLAFLNDDDRLPWHFHGWEENEDEPGAEFLTIAERSEWRETPDARPHVTYEEAAVIINRKTDHREASAWREQKEALGARMVELLNLAESAVYVLDARGYDIPELYRFANEEAAVEWCKATGRYNDEDGIESDVHVLGLSEVPA